MPILPENSPQISAIIAPMNKIYAILPAGGSGSRLGAGLPKQYLPLLGKPLIAHTLSAMMACHQIERILVVLAPGDFYWRQHDWSFLGTRVETVFCGGGTRAESVLAGLEALERGALDNDWVLVHDAARPCLSPATVTSLIETLASDPVGGLLAVPVADTLKREAPGPGGVAAHVSRTRVASTVDRDGLWQAQTPQMFRFGLLRQALRAAASQVGTKITDESSAMEAMGHSPRLVVGDMTNLKVTYPSDLAVAEMILRSRR